MNKSSERAMLAKIESAATLQDPVDIAAHLNSILVDYGSDVLPQALGVITRSHGMTEVSHRSGLARESLYKALRADAQPRFDTIWRVCRALGVTLTITANK